MGGLKKQVFCEGGGERHSLPAPGARRTSRGAAYPNKGPCCLNIYHRCVLVIGAGNQTEPDCMQPLYILQSLTSFLTLEQQDHILSHAQNMVLQNQTSDSTGHSKGGGIYYNKNCNLQAQTR